MNVLKWKKDPKGPSCLYAGDRGGKQPGQTRYIDGEAERINVGRLLFLFLRQQKVGRRIGFGERRIATEVTTDVELNLLRSGFVSRQRVGGRGGGTKESVRESKKEIERERERQRGPQRGERERETRKRWRAEGEEGGGRRVRRRETERERERERDTVRASHGRTSRSVDVTSAGVPRRPGLFRTPSSA